MKCKNCGYLERYHPVSIIAEKVHTFLDWKCEQFIPNHSPSSHVTEDKDPDSGNDLRHNDSGSAFISKSAQGKKNRLSGAAFERRVRADLESKGWIVDKWTNNVEFIPQNCDEDGCCVLHYPTGKIHPAKSFRGITRSNGFPDFIAFRCGDHKKNVFWTDKSDGKEYADYEVIAVEVKTNGILSKIEKEKCTWYLDNNIFSKILIASKGSQRGEIVYTNYERGLKKK